MRPTSHPLQITPLSGIPEITAGAPLGQVLSEAILHHGFIPGGGLPAGALDVLVVAQKVVSKAEGRVVNLDDVTPGEKAKAWAAEWGKDPRVVELVLQESKRIVRMEHGVLIAETHHGFVCANAGVDSSNSGGSNAQQKAVLLPKDPDASARQLREELLKEWPEESRHAARLAVIIADSFGRPWRLGQTQVALGVAGLDPLADLKGFRDADGRKLEVTEIAVADELACAADLVCPKDASIPAALIRPWYPPNPDTPEGTAQALLRPADKDLFR